MTPKGNVIALVLAISWIENIAAASFSNVLVQRGPLEYINYNPSALSFGNQQLAQLSETPLESVVSLPSVSSIVSPCVTPCIISNGAISALAPIPSTTNAKIVTYKSSLASVPVVLANKDEARGYQYAYAVFDENTGDKKTQSEHSDGSIVQGQYSFIQPDGFRREVIYTADDSKGFNAVVRNISPEPEHHTEEKADVSKETIKPSPTCIVVKSEHLTHASQEAISKETQFEIEHMEEKKSEENKETKSEDTSEDTSEDKSAETSTEKSAEKVSDKSQEESQQTPTTKPVESAESSQAAEQTAPIPNGDISYNDIINCLQSKIKGARNIVSPLTYVLVPSSIRPC